MEDKNIITISYSFKRLQREALRVNIAVGIIIILFTIILIIDFNRRLDVGDREVIGKVTYIQKDNYRRMGGRVVWEEIEKTANIYNYDVIKTSDYSSVTVIMNDKSEINIGENSMIVFKKGSGEINLDFVQGNFNVNTKKADQSAKNKIRVKSGNVELNVDDANISLDKSKTADVRFDVKEGKVELSKDGNKQIINQNELLTVKGEKLFKIKKNVKYQNPKNLSVFYTSEETKSIPFNWETNEESKQTYILEIKNTESIKEKDYKIQVNSSNYSVSLKPGKYVWKVYSEDDPNKAFAPAQSFHIIQNSASEIYIPEDKREFTYTRNLPEILFSWKKIDFIDYYKLEVSKDANFSSILRSIKTKNTSTILNNLETGTYYYRLISKLELDGATEKISGLKSFSIKKIFSISPPLLVSPENNYTYYYNEFKFALVLIWKYNSEYSSYRVLVSKDKNFQNIVFQTKTSSESIDIRDELKDGVYYWKVIGSWKEEDKNTDSEIRSIQIQKILPGSIKLTSPVNGSTFNPGNLTFKWEEISEDSLKYILELGREKNFKNIVYSRECIQTSCSVDMKSGNYFWRVKGLTKSGKTFITQQPFSLQIKALKLPEIIFPQNKGKVDMLNRDSLSISWKNEKEYSAYSISLIRLSDNSSIYENSNFRGNTLTISDITRLKTGDYIFKIQGKLTETNTYSDTSNTTFRIYLSKTIEKDKIEFITPEDVYLE